MITGTKIKLSLLGIFILGFLIGVSADRFFRLTLEEGRFRPGPGRGPGPPRPTEMLTDRLKLRPDQVKKVDEILDQAGEEYMKLRTQLRPQFDEVRNRQRQQILAILDPSQKEAYENLLKEMEQHRRSGGQRK